MKLSKLLEGNSTQELQQFISQRFVQNMEFFKKSSPYLFKALQLPPKDYNLVFNEKGFNVFNLHHKQIFYPELDGYYTMTEVHKELSNTPLSNSRWHLKSNEVFLQTIDEKSLPITGGAINAIIKILQKFSTHTTYSLGNLFLPSTAIYGLSGGIFLELLREKNYFFHSLFIFEENLDLFRISCYFVHYALLFEQVSDKALYLFVEKHAQQQIIYHFFNTRKVTSNFMLLELQLYESERIQEAKSIIDQNFRANKRGWGSFEDERIGLRNTLDNLRYSVLTYPNRVNAPICVVGNGPSLDELLPFIKKNQEKMVIFSCGTALKPLKDYGINPDFQIEIERIDYLREVLKSAPLGDTTLLCGNMVNPYALRLAKEAFIFLRGGSASSYLLDSSVIECASPFVGNAGAALAMQMGSEIILCGIDCGYIQGKTKHAQGSFYKNETIQIPNNAICIKANANLEVYADSLFLLSKQNLEQAISIFKPKMVLNLGCGAYINGARPTKSDEFELRDISKTKLIKQMKSYMKPVKIKNFKSYISEVYDFFEKIKNILRQDIQTKKQLFSMIDCVIALVAQMSSKSPHLGILFEGSLGHLLQNLLLASLHIHTRDLKNFYHQSLEVIFLSFDQMIFSYHLLLQIRESEHFETSKNQNEFCS